MSYSIFDFKEMFSPMVKTWDRMFKEIDGYSIRKVSDGYVIVFNTVGIAASDIHVSREKADEDDCEILSVKGSTKIKELEDNEYNVDYRIGLQDRHKLEAIQYKVRDGLTIVHLKYTIPKIDSIDAKMIDPDKEW